MIIYLATYPRSGNDLLQAIIRRNLHRMTSQISGETIPAKAFQAGLDAPGWEVRAASERPKGWPGELVWNARTAVARFGEEPWRRMLLPGPVSVLERSVRTALAEEDELFFLKLHDHPFKDYLPGERVIQVVRHPGAVLWSLFRYVADTRLSAPGPNLFRRPPLTVDEAIKGDALFGGWADYHAAWLAAARSLGSRHLWLRFEDVTADVGAAAERIGAFLDLPVLSDERVDFEVYRRMRPGMDLTGTSRGYEPYFTARQLVDLWERHGPVAEAFGYAPPDYGAATDNAQLRRLEAMVQAAWTRGGESEQALQDLNEQIARVRAPRG